MSELECSFLSYYKSDYYSHGYCLFSRSPEGWSVLNCYCEDGYNCVEPERFDIQGPEPNACEPDPEQLLALLEKESNYIGVAIDLAQNRSLESADAIGAIEKCIGRIHRLREGLRQWHNTQKEMAKLPGKKQAKKRSASTKSRRNNSKSKKKKSRTKAKR